MLLAQGECRDRRRGLGHGRSCLRLPSSGRTRCVVISFAGIRPDAGRLWLAGVGSESEHKEAVEFFVTLGIARRATRSSLGRTYAKAVAHDAPCRADPGAFTNWMTVLSDMGRERVGLGPETLRFATRSGLHISCPNQRGARVPIYEIFAEDCYRLEWFLGPLMVRPLNVIDIGGQVGTFACWLAHIQPQATITSFEPSPVTVQFLRRNIAQNDLEDRITVVERAMAATSGWAEFADNGGGSGTNGLVSAGHSVDDRPPIKVQTVTFDEVVASASSPIDFVKIDCEGGEYDLVLASSPQSWESVQRVVLEYHPVAGHEWPELMDWFERAGLRVEAESSAGGYGTVWLSRTPLVPNRN